MWNQYAVDAVYRFLADEKLFVGVRYNKAEGDAGRASPATSARTAWQVGGGWFILPGLLAKAEYVNQKYFGYPGDEHPERRQVQRLDARRRRRASSVMAMDLVMRLASPSRAAAGRSGVRRLLLRCRRDRGAGVVSADPSTRRRVDGDRGRRRLHVTAAFAVSEPPQTRDGGPDRLRADSAVHARHADQPGHRADARQAPSSSRRRCRSS